MGIIRKYAFGLALSLAVIYAYAPLSLEDFAKPRWLDDISVIVNKSLAPAKPEVRVDPIAAANVDEDLDYRIAQRMKSTEGCGAQVLGHSSGLARMRNLHAPRSTNWLRRKSLPRRRPPRASNGELVGHENSERARLSRPAFITVRNRLR